MTTFTIRYDLRCPAWARSSPAELYAAALEQGFSPATLIENLDVPIMTLQGAWVPEDEHLDSPSITMRMALRTSSNRAAVRMLDNVGIPITVEYAQRMECDLLVMASHGRRGVTALLLGSETQKVLTHTTIPVLVVR